MKHSKFYHVIITAFLCMLKNATAQEEEFIRTAVHVTPSPRQYAWQQLETIAFVHFGMNTFTDREWGDGTESPALFNPSAFDARQWARVCKEAGLKMIIVTAKHHDGFCLWPSAYTEHSVKNAPWRNGRGDVVREVADACREYGLQFGFYLSPWDRHEPSYGDSPRYNAHFMNQLRELLTQYGEVSEVWFDGACGEGPNGKKQVYDFPAWYRLIRELQPHAVIAIMGPDVRWVGTEEGYARDSEWSVLPAAAQDTEAIAAGSQQQASDAGFIPQDRTDKDLGSREIIRGAQKLIWYPAEADVSIRPGWFYHASQDERVKTPEKLIDIYYGSVGRNAVLLLNIPPDQRGLIHENDAAALQEMNRILDNTFNKNLLKDARITSPNKAVVNALTDRSLKTFWQPAPGGEAVLDADLGSPQTFDVLALQENILAGQRIESFTLQVEEKDAWCTVAQGTTVGYKRLLRFAAVTAARVRLLITQSRSEPTLAEWGLYQQPPDVEIQPGGGTFTDSIQVVLCANHHEAMIHYTLDGSAPSAASPRYTGPLALKKTARLAAIAIAADGRPGLAQKADFNQARYGLSLAAPFALQYSAGGALALLDGVRGSADFNDGHWQGFEGTDLDATIDLGQVCDLHALQVGFLNDPGSWIFLPTSITVRYSQDGKNYVALPTQTLPDLSRKQTFSVRVGIDQPLRYLHITARNRSVCPPGHPGAGGKAWIFADEIRFSENSAAKLNLVENGQTHYRMVVPQKATAADNRAAELLQKYISQSTGAELPIVTDKSADQAREILIGLCRRTPKKLQATAKNLGEDAFYLGSHDEKIILLGGTGQGAVYGAIHFLEKYLGCRKYSPKVERIPHHESLRISVAEEIQKPANRFRSINTRFVHDPDYKEWMRLDDVNDIYARGYYVHTFERIIPRAEYFESHPDYFCWMNGKRIHDQLCMSHPEVLRLTIEHLRKVMAEQPQMRYWSVSQNDNFSYCQCPKCQHVIDEEGSPAGPLLRFVNAVAKEFPDKIISTLAYQFSRPAPRITKPGDNVHIVLCTIELNRSKSIENDPESASFVKDIRDWSRLTKNLFVWDYVVQFTNFVSPFPNLHVLQPNLQFFVRNNAFEHFQQSNGQSGGEMAELKNWLIAKWLWDPDLNADSLREDFLTGYYGAAAPHIHSYIDRLEAELIRCGDRLDIYGSPVWHAETVLSADNTALYNGYFDTAEASVAVDPDLLQRVRTTRLPLQYAIMEIGKNDLFGPRGWYVESPDGYTLRPGMRQMLEDFHRVATAAGLRLVNESGVTVDDYYQTTLRFIDVKVDGNHAFRKAVTAEPLPSPKYARGDLAVLSNGVQGANDYKVHWLGWEGVDFQVTLDLEKATPLKQVRMATLYDPKSWILHPRSVTCLISKDGHEYQRIGSQVVAGDQRKEEVVRDFVFTDLPEEPRFIRFEVQGTKALPAWHPSEGGLSWVFIDEIVAE